MSLITIILSFITSIRASIDNGQMWQKFEHHHFFCSIRRNIATRTLTKN